MVPLFDILLPGGRQARTVKEVYYDTVRYNIIAVIASAHRVVRVVTISVVVRVELGAVSAPCRLHDRGK